MTGRRMMLSNSLVENDKLHWVHPVSAWKAHAQQGPLIFDRAEGIYLYDVNGKQYLDGFAGLWCMNIGYGQNSVIDAIRNQLEKLPYATGYFGFASEPAIRLAQKIAEITPGDLNHVYFTLGGSDAIDTALRFIDLYWNLKREPQRKHMISVEKGYHGSSSTGAGITALPAFHANFSLPLPTQHRIPSPHPYRSPYATEAEIIAASVQALKAKVAELGTDKVAAFFVEPVQGSGGVIVPPKGWLKAMRDTCTELGILMVIDEVITGFGRTGVMFAQETEGVQADIMTMAKGMTSGYVPMGACVLSGNVYSTIAELSPAGQAIGHGQTYSGHPVAAAAALEVIRLYQEGGILENAAKLSPYFLERLNTLRTHPLVGDVRASGLLAAVEIVADKNTKEPFAPASGLANRLMAELLENGLIVRCFADATIGLAPALNINRDEIDLIVDRIRKSLDAVSPERL